jgi:ComEC/Rec2-related protein
VRLIVLCTAALVGLVVGDVLPLVPGPLLVATLLALCGVACAWRKPSSRWLALVACALALGGWRASVQPALVATAIQREAPPTPAPPGRLSAQGLSAQLASVRSNAQIGITRYLPEPQASLAAGVLLGGTGNLDADVRLALQRSGLAHVVAIDGFKQVVVASAIGAPSVWLLGRYLASVPIMLGLVGYTLLTGAHPSAVRAGLMVGLATLAALAGRVADPLTSLLLAVVLMALFEPRILLDVGLQLSVSAVLGIVLLWPRMRPRPGWTAPASAEDASDAPTRSKYKASLYHAFSQSAAASSLARLVGAQTRWLARAATLGRSAWPAPTARASLSAWPTRAATAGQTAWPPRTATAGQTAWPPRTATAGQTKRTTWSARAAAAGRTAWPTRTALASRTAWLLSIPRLVAQARWVVEPAGLTLAVTLATLPVVLSVFQVVSLVSPLAHVFAIPLLPLVLAGATLLALAAPVEPLAHLVSPLAWLPTTLLLQVIRFFGNLPGAALSTGRLPPLAAAGLAGLLLGWGLWNLPEAASLRRRWLLSRAGRAARSPPAPYMLACLTAAVLLALLKPDGRLHVQSMPVGRGAAVLIRGPTGRTTLVVGGSPNASLLANQVAARLPVWEHQLDSVLVLDEPAESKLALTLARYPAERRLSAAATRRMDLGGGATLEVVPSGGGATLEVVPSGGGATLEVVPTGGGGTPGIVVPSGGSATLDILPTAGRASAGPIAPGLRLWITFGALRQRLPEATRSGPPWELVSDGRTIWQAVPGSGQT